MARVQRHVAYNLALHHIAQGASIGLQQRNGFAGNFDGFRNTADLKRSIHVRDLVHLDHDIVHYNFLEPVGFHLEGVHSWSQLQELKTTVAIAYGSNLGVRRNAGERQFRARNQRSGLVFYGTGYASCWRGGNCWSKHQGERGKYNSQDAGHSGWIHGLPP